MARTVKDLAILLDSMAGYDPEDPITARGVGHIPDTFTKFLVKDGLKGVRLGVLRESIGLNAEPGSEDFKKISAVFDKAVNELKAAGAEIIDPIAIPDIKELLAKRSGAPGETDESFKNYYGRSAKAPFKTPEEATRHPDFSKVVKRSQERFKRNPDPMKHYESLRAQDQLMTNFLKVMADHNLDAIVHKTVEHQPTLIKDGVAPPFTDQKGAPHLNTFLIYVPTITVPAGFTDEDLPAGLCFIGRPYDDANMIKYAYAYEQATLHRKAPPTTPAL
jgi:Asp-tRNA(Asn)/Glu-tRNA(Gln) amidotransferase A subunit family amidase